MRTLVILALVLALAIPVTAEHCGDPHWDQTVVTTPGADGVSTYHAAVDHCHDMCVFSIWIYQETNGIEGLQRGDEVRDDTCGGRIEADTIVF